MAEYGIVEATINKKTLHTQGNYGPVYKKTTLTGGAYLSGQVLGVITASGKAAVYNNAAVDGTGVARFVLAENSDASLADKTAMVYQIGVMAEANLVGLDAAGKTDLEAVGFLFA